MLEPFALQEPNLFRGRQSLHPALRQPIQEQRRLAGGFDLVRENAQLFQGGPLLVAGRPHLPSEGGDIAGQVCRLDGHFKLQGIHQLTLTTAHFGQLLCQGLLPLGHNVLAGLFLGLLNVNRASGCLDVLGHLPGNLVRFTNQVGGVAQLMALGMPQEVQEQQVFFAGKQAGTTPHHLAIQAPYLCGPQHYHTIHAGAVPALGQQHGVTQDVILPLVKGFEDFRPVLAVAVDLCRPEPLGIEQAAKLLRSAYQGQEYHRLAVLTVGTHFLGDLV